MRSVRVEQDAAGNFMGGSHMFSSARDLAKLGYLLLKDGVWEGQRILPEGWIDYMTEVSPSLLQPQTSLDFIRREGVFGRSIWVNKDVRGIGTPFPRAPKDMFFAGGQAGQFLLVVPSQDMVIARTGWDKEYWQRIDKIMDRAIRCFSQELK